MKILGNSTYGLLLYQKYLLYRICTLSIALYSFPLWYYNKVPLSVTNSMSDMQSLDASFFYLTSLFYFLFDLFSLFGT